ncbi:recombinase family protein [Rurimicrobium arvi]|uniref:Recombinase family protein n=1 Tax=Rurimicrobium arvi TaxID=2049916 RepID=A0ABP8MW01_9BACT
MADLSSFQRFAKLSGQPVFEKDFKEAVKYTRVSSKEQQDTNLSLDFQNKTIDEYAARNGFTVHASFGGKFESAKTDGRKEFQRMLEYIKKKKGRIGYILIYTTSRFSRTGGGAIKLAADLRRNYGVRVLAVTQPTDTATPTGQFHQNMELLISQYDNELRRQATMAGSKEHLEQGIWCLRPPLGYDAIMINGKREIVINQTGEQLRKAFTWKLSGTSNEEILRRLKTLGVTTYKQKLSQIFSNPFYAGIIVNKMLNGKVVKGIHPKLITEEVFLKVNQVRAEAKGKFGTYHQNERDEIPLKLFTKCDRCGNAFTGYIVKAKNLYYYKCRTTGCKCNKSAKTMNEQFIEFLSTYSIKQEFVEPLIKDMTAYHYQKNQDDAKRHQELKKRLSEIEGYLDNIDENFHVKGTMSGETYQKFKLKYLDQRAEITQEINNVVTMSSNLTKLLETAAQLSVKLASTWTSSTAKQKEALQKLVFPDGVYYNLEKQAFRTEKVNSVFALFASLARVSEEDKNKQGSISATLSSQVGMTGFEPAASSSRTKRATGLRYIPKDSIL